ncbi:MAG: GNAT family N-acetyltransferase [Pseudomonadota bacterium]
MAVRISQAGVADVQDIAPLFDAYRQFYKQAPDLHAAQHYLKARLSAGQSTIFLARGDSGAAAGFTQLYPTFCSVSAAQIWVLYDLFVARSARRRGIGRALLQHARAFCGQTGAAWMKLETEHTNIAGQTLYESEGWERDTEYRTYTVTL